MLLSTQGPFPPRSLPRFPGTTGLSATLTARPAPRGVPVDVCRISARASRVAAFFPFHACQRHYPDGSRSVPASLSSPSANGLPLKLGGSASVLSVSRPARRSLAFRPAWSLSRPWRPLTPECFRPFRCLHDPPWLLPTGATVVGRDSHPPEEGAFPRRTGPSWITLFSFVSGTRTDGPPSTTTGAKMLLHFCPVGVTLSWEEAHLGARASRPHKAWRSFGHLLHRNQPAAAPCLCFGRAVGCNIAGKLSGTQRERMRAGRPRSRGCRPVDAVEVGAGRLLRKPARTLGETPVCPRAGPCPS